MRRSSSKGHQILLGFRDLIPPHASNQKQTSGKSETLAEIAMLATSPESDITNVYARPCWWRLFAATANEKQLLGLVLGPRQTCVSSRTLTMRLTRRDHHRDWIKNLVSADAVCIDGIRDLGGASSE